VRILKIILVTAFYFLFSFIEGSSFLHNLIPLSLIPDMNFVFLFVIAFFSGSPWGILLGFFLGLGLDAYYTPSRLGSHSFAHALSLRGAEVLGERISQESLRAFLFSFILCYLLYYFALYGVPPLFEGNVAYGFWKRLVPYLLRDLIFLVILRFLMGRILRFLSFR